MVGSTISHYRIVEKLGEGGMGVVYKAEDTKLERPVALKFLASHAVEDPEHKARFVREAKAAARLDHQNICPVYEIDEVDRQIFLAMAFLEGQTVKEKIAERPLKLDEALDIAIQTAEGLQAAHEKGIVHRDIKSANLMVSPQGQVKIMDFGLAQLADRSQLTKTATILGTPAYMSPEQARREPTDRRTDIWSLGVVIYEMVTGRLPFEGERQEAVLYAIGSEEPEPVTGLRAGLPMELEWIVGKALAKDAGERYQHVEDLLVDLNRLRQDRSSSASASRGRASEAWQADRRGATIGSWQHRFPWAVAAVLAVFLALALGSRFSRPSVSEAGVERFSFQATVHAESSLQARVSPNGRHIAYLSSDDPRIWIRDLDSEEPRPLDGTEGAVKFFWSPDSRFVGFVSAGMLRKITTDDGAVVDLCSLPPSVIVSAAWSPDGTSIFGYWGGPASAIHEVAAAGGEPVKRFDRLRTDKGGDNEHFSFLPENATARAMLLSVGSATDRDVVLLNLDTGETQVLAEGAWPVYSLTGHIIYQSAPQVPGLWALPFSLETLKPSGEAFAIAANAAGPSVSADGKLVYVDFFAGEQRQLVWRDRRGNRLGSIGQPQQQIRQPLLSPDKTKVLVYGTERGEGGIWIHEVARPVKTRWTFEGERGAFAFWLDSGRSILHAAPSDAGWTVYRSASDGSGEPVVLSRSEEPRWVNGLSPDENRVLYTTRAEETGFDLGYLERAAPGSTYEAVPLLKERFGERLGRLSPDGRFVAYCSNETGRDEVYVRSFPGGGGKVRISENGGCGPRWSHDGEELFYVEANLTLFAVPFETTPAFSAGRPVELFRHDGFVGNIPDYDVSPDGERFVMVESIGKRADRPRKIRIVQNWYEEFRGREQE